MHTRLFVSLFIFLKYIKASTICDSLCVCGLKNQESFGETIDCSYSDNLVLKSNITLPDIVFSLDLSSTNLSRLQSSTLLKSNTMLQLYLNNNEITDIAMDTFQVPELKRLDLSNNKLEMIEKETFKSLKNLEYLNLANNRFSTYSSLSLHHLSNLNEIILDNNDLGPSLMEYNLFYAKGIGLAHKIKTLSISGINLNVVPDNFFIEAYDLKKLIISNNNLSDIFELPFTLEYLDLSDNPIQEISNEDFADSPALKTLKLNNLKIKTVPEYVFSPLKGLIELELERNRNLTKFSPKAFGQDVLEDADDFVLERLSLKGSRLTMLDKRLALPFGQLVHLDLQGNPWRCDCNVLWIKTLQISPRDAEYLRCGTPRSLYNSRVFDLEDEWFTCPMRKQFTGLIIAGVCFVVVLTAMAIWLFLCLPKYQTRETYVRHIYPTTVYSVLPLSFNTDR